MNPEIIRRYDIRGLAESDLRDEVVYDIGRAYGSLIRRAGGRQISLGRDARLSGPRIQATFSRGVRAAGVDVLDIGELGTPLLYFSLHTLPVDGGVIITGSHNPSDWNGLKICVGTASLHGEKLQALGRMIQERDFEEGAGREESQEIQGAYLDQLAGDLRRARPLKVVVDAGNGTGGIAVELYRRLGFEVFPLFCEPDGHFPNHHPDPTVEANLSHLRAAVLEHQADLGLAFDGDSDRLGAVDQRGRVVWGDQLLLFLGRALLKERPGAGIVGEVKCSRLLFEGLKAAGGHPEMWKVGHSLIKARMRESGALLAGEMSGHLFFADRYFGYDDAIYAGGRLLELLSERSDSLAEMLDALPQTYTTPEIRRPCPDQLKFELVERAQEHFKARYPSLDIDGVRIEFPQGWGLIRASNTQPILVMRFEAETEEALSEQRTEVENWLEKALCSGE